MRAHGFAHAKAVLTVTQTPMRLGPAPPRSGLHPEGHHRSPASPRMAHGAVRSGDPLNTRDTPARFAPPAPPARHTATTPPQPPASDETGSGGGMGHGSSAGSAPGGTSGGPESRRALAPAPPRLPVRGRTLPGGTLSTRPQGRGGGSARAAAASVGGGLLPVPSTPAQHVAFVQQCSDERLASWVTRPHDEVAALISGLVSRVPRRHRHRHRDDWLRAVTARADVLPLSAKAAVLCGLHRAWRSRAVDPVGATALLLACRGRELTRLKDAVDRGADKYDLQRLVYYCLDRHNRGAVLAHFQAEAERLRMAAEGRLPPTKILSDVDDTYFANWKDVSYPKGTVYPGVRAVHTAVKQGVSEYPGALVFLSARPGAMKNHTHYALRNKGSGDFSLLAGSVTSLLTHAAMARKKMSNFLQYMALFPEFRFCFIGDSGQGDALVGEMLYEAVQHGQLTRQPLVLIHNIVVKSHQRSVDRDGIAAFRRRGVYLFDTYIDAAELLLRHGFITGAAAARVAREAVADLHAVRFSSAVKLSFRTAEMRFSLRELQALLPYESLPTLSQGTGTGGGSGTGGAGGAGGPAGTRPRRQSVGARLSHGPGSPGSSLGGASMLKAIATGRPPSRSVAVGASTPGRSGGGAGALALRRRAGVPYGPSGRGAGADADSDSDPDSGSGSGASDASHDSHGIPRDGAGAGSGAGRPASLELRVESPYGHGGDDGIEAVVDDPLRAHTASSSPHATALPARMARSLLSPSPVLTPRTASGMDATLASSLSRRRGHTIAVPNRHKVQLAGRLSAPRARASRPGSLRGRGDLPGAGAVHASPTGGLGRPAASDHGAASRAETRGRAVSAHGRASMAAAASVRRRGAESATAEEGRRALLLALEP